MPRLAGDEEWFVLVERGLPSPVGRKKIAQRFIAGIPGDGGNESRQGRKNTLGIIARFLPPLTGLAPYHEHDFSYKTNRNRMHSFVSCLMHCVWATKERRPFIKPDLQQRLWPYLGGIARENKMKTWVVGGVEDHVHVLLSVPSTLSVAKAVQLLKGNSSKWIHDTFKEHWGFEWQEGYGGFSIAISGVEDTTKYIQSQAEHHRKMTFKEELEVFLKKHGMEYAEQDLE